MAKGTVLVNLRRDWFGPDGSLYIGGVGMVGGWSWKEKQYGLQKMKYNRKTVFDMLAIRSKRNGFEIEFTEPVTDTIEFNNNTILVQQWWYLPTADYGGPKKDLQDLQVSELLISGDRKHIKIVLPQLKEE